MERASAAAATPSLDPTAGPPSAPAWRPSRPLPASPAGESSPSSLPLRTSLAPPRRSRCRRSAPVSPQAFHLACSTPPLTRGASSSGQPLLVHPTALKHLQLWCGLLQLGPAAAWRVALPRAPAAGQVRPSPPPRRPLSAPPGGGGQGLQARGGRGSEPGGGGGRPLQAGAARREVR